MSETYLQRVLIYLQQELPGYKKQIKLYKGKIVIDVLAVEKFQQVYDEVYAVINECVGRIRNREMDLDFIVKSKRQERDFKIQK